MTFQDKVQPEYLVNTRPYYEALLGKWREFGFRLEEVEDHVKEWDMVIVLYHQDVIVGSTYRSSLTLNGISVIQHWCERYFNENMERFTSEKSC